MKNKALRIVFKEKTLFIVSVLIILIYFFPYLYFGEDSHILIHDNLDSNVAWVKMFLSEAGFFKNPNDLLNQVFNGIPQSIIFGSLDLSLLWFKFFGMYWGYVVNKFLMTIVAFLGMYFLLKTYFSHDNPLVSIGVSLSFALLPFWSFTMSVCGLPLLLYAFLNIRKGQNVKVSWSIICVFPFITSLVLSGFFFIILLGLIVIYDLFNDRKYNVHFMLGILLFSGLYVVSHFPLFYSFIFKSTYVSHREEFVYLTLNFFDSLKSSQNIFLNGQYHAHSLHKYMLAPIFVSLIVFIKQKKIKITYLFIVLFIVLTSVLYGFKNWEPAVPLVKKIMEIIPFQIQRFHFLHPMLWYVLFGISLVEISKIGVKIKVIIPVILVLQLLYVFSYHEAIKFRHLPTYKQFYSVALFKDVKQFINKPTETYKVISVGLHPSIAQYNGFYTLDGYFASYPLSYKHKFRKVIEKELDKNDGLKKYFDNWGSRCYSFSTELERDFLNPNPDAIENLDFNYDKLKELGGTNILSTTKINNDNIRLLKVFKKPSYFWSIYLYKIN